MMIDSIAGMLSDGDKESLDRYWFAELPSVRSSYYVRNGDLYVDTNDPPFPPF